jgi:hypothetical protein
VHSKLPSAEPHRRWPTPRTGQNVRRACQGNPKCGVVFPLGRMTHRPAWRIAHVLGRCTLPWMLRTRAIGTLVYALPYGQQEAGFRRHVAALLCAGFAATACLGEIRNEEGGGSDVAADPDDPLDPLVSEPFEASPFGLRRLTAPQYANALHELLGASVEVPDARPQDDVPRFGLSNVSAHEATFSSADIEQLEAAAVSTVRSVFSVPAKRLALIGCAPENVDDPCVSAFLSKFGRRAFRRPLTTDELSTFQQFTQDAAATFQNVAWRGLEYAVVGFLQSPSFLYQVATGTTAQEGAVASLVFTEHELAARLALFLWDSIPDEALVQATDRGDLATPAGIRAQALRMLEDPRAREPVIRMFRELYGLDSLEVLSKDTSVYPAANQGLFSAMKTEIEQVLVDVIFTRRADFQEIFTTRSTFANGELAQLYGASGVSGSEFVPVTLPADGPRAGLLGFGGILALGSREARTSPTLRGLFIREVLLCAGVPPPPPEVEDSLPPEPSGTPQTARERLEIHRTSPSCSGCHSLMDPPGLALEHFDGIGAWRSDDRGLALDATGAIGDRSFDGLVELGQVLRGSPQVTECLVRQLYRHATGHEEETGEQAVIDDLTTKFVGSGHQLLELMADIVASDGFRFTRAPL